MTFSSLLEFYHLGFFSIILLIVSIFDLLFPYANSNENLPVEEFFDK